MENSALANPTRVLSFYFLCAVSSVVEHYLDTVGVRGSNPLSRTRVSFSMHHGIACRFLTGRRRSSRSLWQRGRAGGPFFDEGRQGGTQTRQVLEQIKPKRRAERE